MNSGSLQFNSKQMTAAWKANNGDNGFVGTNELSSPNIICHKNATPGVEYLNIAAGDTLKMKWSTWADSHKGPVLTYLAACPGECTTVNKASLQFVKIAEGGFRNGVWASDAMMKRGNVATAVIPASLKAGNYVIRHEIIALHGGGQGQAQLYPQCANIKVTGGGSSAISGGVPGSRLYSPNDGGIHFDLYKKFTSYPIPGPKLWTGR
ncbi:glycoside hydrolase [Microthyrium microscopicum]|uniref:Glycoside hydrolase n=1 Tax=Microthyrium microscopicum TaxID=703497 RepID=A0A6A6U6Y7_9PEZI|nr:glycoside hydrolase [Microthyrium microscopicum]